MFISSLGGEAFDKCFGMYSLQGHITSIHIFSPYSIPSTVLRKKVACILFSVVILCCVFEMYVFNANY